jgi:Fe-S oxidoreductase
MTPADATVSQAIRDADLCVKCGLCLPHCPTYLDSRIEGDGPRGRIALIEALAAGTLVADPRLQGHLDGCLSCRACEAVCPAKVPYGRLIDHGRQLLARIEPRRTRLAALASWWLATRGRRRLFAWPLWLAQRLGLFVPLRRGWLGRPLARLATLLPLLPLPLRPRIGTRNAQAERVLLFGGCVTELAERSVLEASARLLRAVGYEVIFPPAQGCCGAIAQHAGLTVRAQQQAEHNLRALAGDSLIAATTSGCAASLRDYGDLAGDDGASLARRVHDVGHLLAARIERLHLAPLHEHVALHLPCTLRNVLREGEAMERLLRRVPG